MDNFEELLAMLAFDSMVSTLKSATVDANGKSLEKLNRHILSINEDKDYIIGMDKKFKGYIGEETKLTDCDGNVLKIGDMVNITTKKSNDTYLSCVCKEKNGEPFVMGIQDGFKDFIVTKMIDNSNVNNGCIISNCKYVRKVTL